LLVVLGAAVAWAAPLALQRTSDYFLFLLPWYEHIIAAGPISAFACPFGNYTPPYYYLLAAVSLLDLPPLIAIKGLSSAGALWLAFAIYRLTGTAEAGAWSLLLPTVVFNVAFLGQADVFWLAPCVLAVAAAMRGEPITTALWASLGFAFKAQAVFLAPFVALVLIRQRAPAWVWLTPVAVYLLSVLPAWFAGWPMSDLVTIYFRQTQWDVAYISSAPNLWMLAKLFAPQLYSIPVGLCISAVAAALYLGVRDPDVAAAALSAALMPFFLPAMHERFFALFEVLAFCLWWTEGAFWVIVLSQGAFLLNLGGMIGGPPALLFAGVIAELGSIVALASRIRFRARRAAGRISNAPRSAEL
jgi:hypothetical protein